MGGMIYYNYGYRMDPVTEPRSGKDTIHLMIATDLHYLSASLTDRGDAWQDMVKSSDGKLTEYSDEILDSLVKQVKKEKPDALVICGDITFNGEEESLPKVTEKLEEIQDAGVPVLMLPGNHDINYPYSVGYKGSSTYPVSNIPQRKFEAACRQFGYYRGSARYAGSFSYVYPLSDRWALMFLDSNTEDAPGAMTAETLKWAEKQLAELKKQGFRCITVTHQNVLPQNKTFTDGFVITNCNDVQELLRKNGVKVNLSGHSHLQHTATEKGLTDYCTGALSVWPLRYAEAELSPDGSFQYQTLSLGILKEESRKRFDETTGRMADSGFQIIEKREKLTAEEKNVMREWVIRMNEYYFSGKDPNPLAAEQGWKLWKSKGEGTYVKAYFESMLEP